MKTVHLGLMCLFFIAGSLLAGSKTDVQKDDLNDKNLNLTVDLQKSTKSEDMLSVTVKVAAELAEREISGIYLLIQNNKTIEIKPSIKDNIATLTFDIDKKDLPNGELYFSYPNKSKCPRSYAIQLKNYIPKN